MCDNKLKYIQRDDVLDPLNSQRICGFKMTNSIDYIVKNIFHMGPNFIPPESVENIACVSKKKLFKQKKLQIGPTWKC